jgi:hypothetical protein
MEKLQKMLSNPMVKGMFPGVIEMIMNAADETGGFTFVMGKFDLTVRNNSGKIVIEIEKSKLKENN